MTILLQLPSRYLHAQILLHRPSFLRICRMLASNWHSGPAFNLNDYSHRRFRSSLGLQSSIQCIGAAVDLISTLHKSTTMDAAGAWWYTMFCELEMHTFAVPLIVDPSLLTAQPFLRRSLLSRSGDSIIEVLSADTRLFRQGCSREGVARLPYDYAATGAIRKCRGARAAQSVCAS